MTNTPGPLEPLFERLEEIYDKRLAAAIEASMAAPKRTVYWINSLKPQPPLAGDTALEGVEGCFLTRDRERLMAAEASSAGSYYPTNPSSVVAARALDARRDEEVLDLAAAPGGKTLQLAAAMGNTGRIAAVEPVTGRFHRLRANLERCGVTSADFYLADGRAIGAKVPGRFDRVLLDAPCSSEARIRLDSPASYGHWKLRKIRECARKQQRLLLSAFEALKPGGRLLYSTCAFAPEENERVVTYLLTRRPEADVLALELPAVVPVREGLTSWQGRALDDRLSRARRVLPDEVWDGFFLCLLTKHA